MKSTPPKSASCAVCALSDARALTEIRLADGAAVVVCGTHALVHERSATARTVAELRELVGERRDRDRRGDGSDLSADALSQSLADAFAAGRRTSEDRRAS